MEVKGKHQVRLTGHSCAVELSMPARDIIFFKWQGHMTRELTERVTAKVDELIRDLDSVELFADTTEMPSYEPAVRLHLMRWVNSLGRRVRRMCSLTSSKLVAAAISLAAKILNNRHDVYSRANEFFATLNDAVARSNARGTLSAVDH